jgi:hypothetical protein
MARIRRFQDRIEAELACGLLRVHGIPARVAADDAGGQNPALGRQLGGVAVVVADRDLDEALALLDATD